MGKSMSESRRGQHRGMEWLVFKVPRTSRIQASPDISSRDSEKRWCAPEFRILRPVTKSLPIMV